MDNESEIQDLRNIIFSRAIPNYVIPVPTAGHKVYQCTDCGDQFIFESSYNNHINRKSMKIIYTCQYCTTTKIYFNRCTLLAHIRSHPFKTATINVTDINIKLLPFNRNSNNKYTPVAPPPGHTQILPKCYCYECKKNISSSGIIYKDRAAHYMQLSNVVHKCPICLFSLPTTCALKVHMRLHFKNPPYFCPECGMHLSYKTIHYPYNHDCLGFRTMRATARFKCFISECPLVHPTNFKKHMIGHHITKVFKCPICIVACFSKRSIEHHLQSHRTHGKAVIFYRCDMCPGKLVLQFQIENHLSSHIPSYVYPCWACGAIFEDVKMLVRHHIIKHGLKDPNLNTTSTASTASTVTDLDEQRRLKIYRVMKRCDKCQRNFTNFCTFDQINIAPNDCPYKCVPDSNTDAKPSNSNATEEHIICHLCKKKISQKWEDIKEHYATTHTAHRCLDVKVDLTKLDMKKYRDIKEQSLRNMHKTNKKISKKIRFRNRSKEQHKIVVPKSEQIPTTSQCNDPFICIKCSLNCKNKEQLETHIITHRDPYMAYQCMECGECFVVKPSFSTHLLLKHNIVNVEDYINTKQCYNERALMKNQHNFAVEEPLRENQCSVCRKQYDSLEDLEKHFRVHGMAFLIKNVFNKNNRP